MEQQHFTALCTACCKMDATLDMLACIQNINYVGAMVYLISCMHASMSSVASISAPDEAVRPKLQSFSDKLFGH